MTAKTAQAETIIRELSGLYPKDEAPSAKERTACYWWGAPDEEAPWWLELCKLVNSPIAQSLYIAHAAEDVRHSRGIKEWGYTVAVEYAGSRGSGQRRRSIVESYRTDWGHQAARDGLFLALWPDLREDVPGIVKRCDGFGCGHQAYQRVRDEVMRQACDLIAGFDMDMEQCRKGKFSRDFIGRWEAATGQKWADYN